MGTVYLARDDAARPRPVALLQVLPVELRRDADALASGSFFCETRTAAGFFPSQHRPRLAQSGVRRIDLLAYAMAYVEGESLAERVKRAGPMGVRELVKLLQDTGYALAYAHGRGVVHRDIAGR